MATTTHPAVLDLARWSWATERSIDGGHAIRALRLPVDPGLFKVFIEPEGAALRLTVSVSRGVDVRGEWDPYIRDGFYTILLTVSAESAEWSFVENE